MTKSSIVRSVFLVMLSVAGASHAGTGYVPLPGITTVGGASYEVQVSVTNSSAQPRQVKQYIIATDTDGTQRPGQPVSLQVQGNRTVVLKPGASRGLFELDGTSEMRFSARLAGLGEKGALGIQLPVITSENVKRANQAATLLGLVANGTRTTDLVVSNLGKQAAQCTVDLRRADGSVIGSTSTISLKALSHRHFTNIFNGLASGITEARAVVSCNKEFYAHAFLADSATGEIAVIGPAGTGDSTLAPPGAAPVCGSNAFCYDARGIVHQPTPGNPVKRVTFTAQPGTFSRIRMTMEVTVGDFFPSDPDGKHLIYWFVINNNKDMPGMLYFRGPNQYTALVRHGIRLTHPEKLKIVKSFQAVPGRTYKVENDYDMGRGVYTVTITEAGSGNVKAVLTGRPNVSQVTLASTDRFIIDMGFPEGKVPDEVPSYGWTYRDIHIEAIQ